MQISFDNSDFDGKGLHLTFSPDSLIRTDDGFWDLHSGVTKLLGNKYDVVITTRHGDGKIYLSVYEVPSKHAQIEARAEHDWDFSVEDDTIIGTKVKNELLGAVFSYNDGETWEASIEFKLDGVEQEHELDLEFNSTEEAKKEVEKILDLGYDKFIEKFKSIQSSYFEKEYPKNFNKHAQIEGAVSIAQKDRVLDILKNNLPNAEISYDKDKGSYLVGSKGNKKVRFIITQGTGENLSFFALDVHFDQKDTGNFDKPLPWSFTNHNKYTLDSAIKFMKTRYPDYIGERK